MMDLHDGNGAGAAGTAATLRGIDEQLRALAPAKGDDPARLIAKLNESTKLGRSVTSYALGEIEQRGESADLYAYIGARAGVRDGRARACVRKGNTEAIAAFANGLDPSALRIGQPVHVAVTRGGAFISDVETAPPLGGELLRATQRPACGEREDGVLEVEVEGTGETAGPKHFAIVSGFVDASRIDAGTCLRVKNGIVYGVLDAHDDNKSWLDQYLAPAGDTDWSEVIGQDEAKDKLMARVDIFCHPEAYPPRPKHGASVVLMEGPPGNGKSLMVGALTADVARHTNGKMRVIRVNGSGIKHPLVGVSQQRIREIFRDSVKLFRKEGVRSVIVFEEIDSMARKRSFTQLDSGVGADVLNELLPILSGSEPQQGVMVVCTTNHAAGMDEALRRAGRLGGNNIIRVQRLDARAAAAIVRAELTQGGEGLLGSEPIELFERAFHEALQARYGYATVGNKDVDIHGQHLTSGALASDVVAGARELVDQHIHAWRRANQKPLTTTLQPVHIYQAARRALTATLDVYQGPNLHEARQMFAGSLVHELELGSLSAVRSAPLPPVPDEYDLAAYCCAA